jgi:hypothetical protein
MLCHLLRIEQALDSHLGRLDVFLGTLLLL